MRLGVRDQIVLISCVPLLFLIAVLAIGFQLRSLSIQSAELSRHVTGSLERADRAYESINDLFTDIKLYHKAPSPAVLRQYRLTKAAIPGELDAVRSAVRNDAAAQARAARFTRDAAQVVMYLDEVFTLMRAGRQNEANAISARPVVQKLGPEYLTAKSAFDDGERADALLRNTEARSQLQVWSTALVAVTVFGIFVTLALAGRVGLRTARRLRILIENATLLARQRPTQPLAGDDEIADVDRVYHTMSRELEEATVLQIALLPQRLPNVPGLRLDSAYVPAATHGRVGGDWFDVFPITNELVGISIGDVSGHGLSAASAMGKLRQTMRVVARIEQQPSRVLRQVNRTLCADDPEALATAMFATLDCTTGLLRWSTAGHPAPLVVRPDRSTTFLEGEGLLLGVDSQATFRDYTTQLDVGYALVLYTDGLVEVEHDYLNGLETLRAAVLAEYGESSHNIAHHVQRRIFAQHAPRDDSALLFIGISALGAVAGEQRRVWHLDARDRNSAQRVKRALLWQLAGFADRAPEFSAVELIYGELLANVARHTPGSATITLEWQDDVPVLHVEDNGPAFQPVVNAPTDGMSESGRGYLIITHYAPDFAVRRIGQTNRVSVSLPLGDG